MSNEVFTGGATTSQHVDAEDDDHFQNTTFKLKRTRSLGLLDEFIPGENEAKLKAIENKEKHAGEAVSPAAEPTNLAPRDDDDQLADKPGSPGSPAATPQSPTSPSPLPFSPELLPHDDSNIAPEPLRHVDYLLHQWDVSDISKSWRYVISRRKNVANAARLENASWRTWAQRRLNLKTLNPEEVNWLKDNDVTWLFGPIVDDDDHDDAGPGEHHANGGVSTASSVMAGDILISRKKHGPKPILKKRTVQELIILHSNLLKLEIATARAEQEQRRREDAANMARQQGLAEKPPEYFDYNAISAKLNLQYKNCSGSNSLAGSRTNSTANLPEVSPTEVAKRLEGLSKLESVEPVAKSERHIHFNNTVEQCMAVNEYDDDDDDVQELQYGHRYYEDYGPEFEEYDDDADDDGEADDDDDEDDDDDDGLYINPPKSPNVMPTIPGLLSSSRADKDSECESISTTNLKVYRSIRLLSPTTLNQDDSSDESNLDEPFMLHSLANSTRAYDYYYDYNSVYEVNANHAVYGNNPKLKPPDVVDLPENISVGLNFQYDIIEDENGPNVYAALPVLDATTRSIEIDDHRERLPITSLENSARPNPLLLDSSLDSDLDSDLDAGLSISARNSSQSLAQMVFGLTPGAPKQEQTEQAGASGENKKDGGDKTSKSPENDDSHYPQQEPEPVAAHISNINPRYSSTSLSKQPHLLSSLHDLFFQSGMTKLQDTENPLSESFFTPKTPDPEEKPAHYAGLTTPPVQRKSLPLPPQTTLENAFRGNVPRAASKKLIIYDSEDDSDSEDSDEGGELQTRPLSRTSFASLHQLAGRNGISASSPEEEPKKGLAMSNLLNSWNKQS